ncbi:MAG: Omp28-related outer membrane protein [Flavobacteriales bacterium]
MKRQIPFLIAAIAFGAVQLNAQSFEPTKRTMIEDHTTGGAWYGWWSPRGIVYLEDFMMETSSAMYEVACIHGNMGADYENGHFDAMYLEAYSDAAANTMLMNGWPCFVLDRKTSASYETETILPTQFEVLSDDFGYANLTIEPVFDSPSRDLSVTVDAHFAVDAENFRLAVVLTEDSVHQPGVNGYSQTNAYNFINGDAADVPMASSSVDFNAHGPVVLSTFMHFRHVAREIIPSYDGQPGSLPESVEAGGVYTYTFETQSIHEEYDETKMRAIALLIDTSTGEIVNCLGAGFNESQTSSIENPVPQNELEATLFPNPAEHSATLEFFSPRGQTVVLQIIDTHGRIVQMKSIITNPGSNQFNIDASQLEEGIYLIEILADGESMASEKLMIKQR